MEGDHSPGRGRSTADSCKGRTGGSNWDRRGDLERRTTRDDVRVEGGAPPGFVWVSSKIRLHGEVFSRPQQGRAGLRTWHQRAGQQAAGHGEPRSPIPCLGCEPVPGGAHLLSGLPGLPGSLDGETCMGLGQPGRRPALLHGVGQTCTGGDWPEALPLLPCPLTWTTHGGRQCCRRMHHGVHTTSLPARGCEAAAAC